MRFNIVQKEGARCGFLGGRAERSELNTLSRTSVRYRQCWNLCVTHTPIM